MNPCACSTGAGEEGGGAAGRRERRRSVAGTRTVSAIRTVSTAGGEAAWSDAVPRPSARYPAAAIPATTTTPTTKPVRDLGFAAGGRARRALPGASGVVGAPVISVGESAVTRTRGPAALRPFLGATTGCSGHTAVAKSSIVGKRRSGSLDMARATAVARNGDGHTAVAKSSIVGKRRSGSLDMARATAVARNGGTAAFLLLASGASSKICL